MYGIKHLNISSLINETSHYVNKMLSVEEEWVDEFTFNGTGDLANKYANICYRHNVENKWVMMVNPEEESLEYLMENQNIDPSKILKVNSKNKNSTVMSIENALRKGNCSAIILPENLVNEEQLERLTKSAQRGRTQCVVIKKSKLH